MLTQYPVARIQAPYTAPMVDLLFILITAALAWHALTWRDAQGRPDTVRLLMGAIALLFCVRVLLVDVLGVAGG